MSVAVSDRPRRISSGLIDAAVAGIVGLLAFGAVVGDAISHDRPYVLAIGVVMVAPLLMRQSRPVMALAVILAAGMALPGDVPFELPAIAVIYTIAARRGWRPAAAGGVAVVVARVIARQLWGHSFNVADAISPAVECAAAIAYGLYIAARSATMEALRERAERMDRERELLAARSVDRERVRIAQELHDIVAHNVSLIVVQAQALGATAGSEEVTRATDGIADLGREAMAEMHRMLNLLRADDEGAERAPQPGLGALEPLIERSRDAGMAVSLSVEGEPRQLPQTLDLSAYRIVQEALTNVFKHAGAADASVAVVYGPHALTLTIGDSGGGAPSPPNGSSGGHGLIGMRERVALFGGTLSAAPRDGRGFEVNAVLPYPRP